MRVDPLHVCDNRCDFVNYEGPDVLLCSYSGMVHRCGDDCNERTNTNEGWVCMLTGRVVGSLIGQQTTFESFEGSLARCGTNESSQSETPFAMALMVVEKLLRGDLRVRLETERARTVCVQSLREVSRRIRALRKQPKRSTIADGVVWTADGEMLPSMLFMFHVYMNEYRERSYRVRSPKACPREGLSETESMHDLARRCVNCVNACAARSVNNRATFFINTKRENVYCAVLYMMREGVSIQGVMTLPKDEWLRSELPDMSCIERYGFNKSSVTLAQRHMKEALCQAVMNGSASRIQL